MRRLAVVGAIVAAVVAASSPAYAASGRIREVTSANGRLTVVFAASDLAPGVELDAASVQVSVDGMALPVTPVVDVADPVVRTAMLVIDTSGSMRGDGMAGAKTAALAFIDSVPADVRIGLVSFADAARLAVRPTQDRAAVRTAVQALAATGETALLDAIALGLAEVGAVGVRSLLVLSDGADTASRSTFDAVLSRASAGRVPVDTVGFRTDEAVGSTLRRISEASRGRSLAASTAAAVGAAFTQAARDVRSQITVHANVPETLAGRQVSLRVAAVAGSERLTDEAVTTIAAAVAATTDLTDTAAFGPLPLELTDSFLDSETTLVTALGLLFLGTLVLLAVGGGLARRDAASVRVRRRLLRYTMTGRRSEESPEPSALGSSAIARSAVDLAGRVVQRRDLESRLALRLEQADVPLRAAEWLLVHVAVTLLPGLLLLLLSDGKPVPAVIGVLVGGMLPTAYLSIKAGRRSKAFLAQMPDTLQLLAGSLSAGYSLPQAVDSVVREGAQPIAKEFQRALVESRLGVPVEDALEDIAVRMHSVDFEWVVMAIRIQREVGGNLSEVLTTVAETMRDRERVRRQVRVLSTEGRLSAWILGGLPPLFAAYLALVNTEYVKPLVTDPIGLLMIAVMGVVFVVGVVWLHKVVRVEV